MGIVGRIWVSNGLPSMDVCIFIEKVTLKLFGTMQIIFFLTKFFEFFREYSTDEQNCEYAALVKAFKIILLGWVLTWMSFWPNVTLQYKLHNMFNFVFLCHKDSENSFQSNRCSSYNCLAFSELSVDTWGSFASLWNWNCYLGAQTMSNTGYLSCFLRLLVNYHESISD